MAYNILLTNHFAYSLKKNYIRNNRMMKMFSHFVRFFPLKIVFGDIITLQHNEDGLTDSCIVNHWYIIIIRIDTSSKYFVFSLFYIYTHIYTRVYMYIYIVGSVCVCMCVENIDL